jgi:starch-binding outer membrane protein, SusD/RagB family
LAMQPFFEKLKADLAEAKTLLPANLSDIYRANGYAVSGLQARIALYMKDWASAITFSTEYINALPLATKANFPGIWTDANSSELAFKLKRTTSSSGPIAVTSSGGLTTTRMGSLFRGTSTATAVGTVTWAPSDKLWNSYDKVNDIRFSSYFKDEPLLSAAGRPSHLIAKYAGGAYGASNENVADGKIFRTGEMYLIRAEAKARSNDLAGAANDVNALRTARITGYTNVSFASLNEAIAAIADERFKELAFEGHRLWDLRRYDMPVTRLASDAPTTSAVSLSAGNFRFLLPIPFSEIQANPTIQQNPGYQ